jgi:ATP-binding cassette subfamily B protein
MAGGREDMKASAAGKTKKALSRAAFLPAVLRGSFGWLAVAAAATILSVFFSFLTPQVIRVLVDSVLGDTPLDLPAFLSAAVAQAGGREALRAHLALLSSLALVFAVLAGAFTYLYRVAVALCSERSLRRLRDELYGHIQRLPYAWHVSIQTGDIIQRCTSDVEVLRNFLTNQMLELFRTVVLVVAAIAWMFTMSAKLTWVSVAFIPIIIGYSGVFFSLISKRFRDADEAEGRLSTAVQENLTGVRVVRAFGREAFETKNFDEKNDEFAKKWVRLGRVMGPYWGVGDFVTALQVLLIVVLGAREAVLGDLTLGQFTVFVSYNSMIAWPLRSFGRILGDMSKMSVSIDRLREILNAPEEDENPDGRRPDMRGDIVFDAVHFAYPGSPEILRGLSMTIPGGKTVGILGGTGSGKSTLTYLLARLYDLPQGAGRVTVGGVDLRDMPRSYVRRNVGLVLQDTFLFSRTLRENIAAGHPNYDLAAVRGAAAAADLDETIEQFPEGYDTLVGERGVTLSGGQKQRMAIARMLMEHTPIQVFDDSLSAVDAETDAKIRAALREKTAGTTTVLIAHRISTIRHADRIFVLQDGRVAEQGTHEELLALGGIYRRVYELQGSAETEGGEANA